MVTGKWIFTVLVVLAGIMMITLGLYQMRSSSVAKLNSSEELHPEDIRDIPSYNKKHGLMFVLYGFLILDGVFMAWLFDSEYSALHAIIAVILPIPFLPVIHNRLLQQHRF